MPTARFLGGAALLLLGVATADAVLSFAWTGPERRRRLRAREGPLFPHVREALVDASRAMLSAVVLRAPPLCGERLRAAERGVARALDDGAGADLRLLLALLAAREGRFGEAMRLYGEVARDDPSDPRPRALAHALSVLTGLPEGGVLRRERERGCLAADDPAQLLALVDELVVAAAVGGAPYAVAKGQGRSSPESNILVVRSAVRRAGVGLAAALRRDEEMPAAKRLQVGALRAFLHMGVDAVLKTPLSVAVTESKEGEDEDDGKEAA